MCYRGDVIDAVGPIFTPRGSGFVLAGRYPLRKYWMAVLFSAPVTMILTWWPSYIWTHTFWRYTECANIWTSLVRQGFRKLSPDRQTDVKQTESTEIINHAASWVVKQCLFKICGGVGSRSEVFKSQPDSDLKTSVHVQPVKLGTLCSLRVPAMYPIGGGGYHSTAVSLQFDQEAL